jgi:hypothetical protein
VFTLHACVPSISHIATLRQQNRVPRSLQSRKSVQTMLFSKSAAEYCVHGHGLTDFPNGAMLVCSGNLTKDHTAKLKFSGPQTGRVSNCCFREDTTTSNYIRLRLRNGTRQKQTVSPFT